MSKETSSLLNKARESVKAARLLAEQGHHDFSVSRSYYAMFYVAEAILLKEGQAFSKHSGVISAFGKLLVKTGKVPEEFHRFLIEGFDHRTTGDYDAESGFNKKEADDQIANAERFVELGAKFLEEKKS